MHQIVNDTNPRYVGYIKTWTGVTKVGSSFYFDPSEQQTLARDTLPMVAAVVLEVIILACSD